MKTFPLDARKVVFWTILLLNAVFAVPYIFTAQASIFGAILITNLAVSAALVACLVMRLRRRGDWEIEAGFLWAHLAQTVSQSSLYVLWMIYVPPVLERLPLIFHQLVLAYACQLLLSAVTQRRTTLTLSNFPLVLSINFFFWVLPAYYWLQLLVIPLGVAIRAFVTRPGPRGLKHIFNPSAIAIALPLYVMLICGKFLTIPVAFTFRSVPHFGLAIFAAGLLPQWLGGTVSIAFSAFSVFALAYPAGIHLLAPDFLGITLLVTDPVTSPVSRRAQLLYGAVYALLIIGFFDVAARYGIASASVGKVLVLPLLNYAVPLFDRLAFKISRKRLPLPDPWSPALTAVYAVVYLATSYFQVPDKKHYGFNPADYQIANGRTEPYSFARNGARRPR